MRRGKFDLAFNLCEGIDGVAELESSVISSLELLRRSLHRQRRLRRRRSVSASTSSTRCSRRPGFRSALRDALAPAIRCRRVGFPAICKPAAEDASLGVEQRSVVRSARALAARVKRCTRCGTRCSSSASSTDAKSTSGSSATRCSRSPRSISRRCPSGIGGSCRTSRSGRRGATRTSAPFRGARRDLPDELTAEVRRIARDAWKLVGGSGYGRVDMRIDAEGRPWILEVNANPDIAPDAGLARMAARRGSTIRR